MTNEKKGRFKVHRLYDNSHLFPECPECKKPTSVRVKFHPKKTAICEECYEKRK